jgi:hypothetical protein
MLGRGSECYEPTKQEVSEVAEGPEVDNASSHVMESRESIWTPRTPKISRSVSHDGVHGVQVDSRDSSCYEGLYKSAVISFR